ncbi:MAG: hypothetical protein AAFV53_37560 [Myxococcota bacterium]
MYLRTSSLIQKMGVCALFTTLLTIPLAFGDDLAGSNTEDPIAEPAEDEPDGEPSDTATPSEGLPEAGSDEPVEGEPVPDGDEDTAELAASLEGPESPWTTGLIMSTIALAIGGISAVLGIWVDRDQQRPIVFAVVMSVLIVAAVTVGMTQSYLDAVSAIEQKQDLRRMLTMVDEIAVASGDPELANIVTTEKEEH